MISFEARTGHAFIFTLSLTHPWHCLFSQDFHTEGTARPPMDKQQDYNLTGWKQTGNKTTLEFERKRDTGDSNDTQFSVSYFTTEVLNIRTAYNLCSDGRANAQNDS